MQRVFILNFIIFQFINFKFINKKKYKVKISISEERDILLDTGGGIHNATRSFKNPFIVINPDTLWSNNYCDELKNLEDLYLKNKKPCLLLIFF